MVFLLDFQSRPDAVPGLADRVVYPLDSNKCSNRTYVLFVHPRSDTLQVLFEQMFEYLPKVF